jgi:dipeptidyl aminopeptidase/acylaminoacyl peptidase
VSKLHPFSRRWCVLWLGAVAFGLLILPSLSHSQQPGRDQQISELQKQIAELQKKLDELKGDGSAAKGARPIAMADILSWNGVHGTALSPDGQWFAHRVGPADGNDELIVHQTKGDKEYRFPVGQAGGGTLTFSNDSKWLAFTTNPPRPGKDQPAQQPAGGKKTALLNLGSGKKVEFENVRRVAFSGESATHLAIHKTSAPAAAAGGKGPAAGGALAGPPIAAAPPSNATDLVLYELSSGNELTLGNVADFAFDKKGQWLAMTIDARDQSNNAIQLRNMSNAALLSLDTGKAVYQAMAWTEKGDGLIVLKGIEDKVYEGKLYSILGFTNFASGTPEKVVFDPQSEATFPRGMAVSLNRPPTWTEDFSAIVFGIHQLQKKDDKAPAKVNPIIAEAPIKGGGGKGGGKKGGKGAGLAPGSANDKPDLVVWHWADERLQSQQQVQAGQDKNFNHLCMYRVADKKFIRVADDKLRQVALAPKGRWAIGQDAKPYQLMSSLDGRQYHDVYAVDLQTGTRQKVLTKNRWSFGASPDGNHFLYYEDGHFLTYEMATGKSYNITAGTANSFVDEEDDHNVVKPPGKVMGWSKDGAFVLLSDHWDIWKLPVHGGQGVNLTVDGKKDAIRYRARLNLNPEEKGIDLNAPIYLSMQAEWSKKAGIGRVDPGKPGVTRLLWDDAEFGGVQKAKNADVIIYTRETHKDYPDYHVTDLSFQNGKKLTNGQPRQDQFLWSSGARLIDYTSAKGDKLQGALFLPANYEKGKSYPTIVYIYEKLSNGLNKYQTPTANGFNKSVYTSNGYAVLMPDIKYKVNDPGLSAVWCVLPAIEAAVATGVVDKNRVGLHGHSWGGYQTAFLITQTDAFKAAIAGAPLTDMVSMYSSIYWNTGSANQPIFESSQGRFTGGYWEEMDAYIRNSPVYHAKNVKTPLIILHNDKDGAVDWNQGIEYFNTLRRLQKPVVLLQYKGENHGLTKPANKKDYTVRMKEFFDHHLMGKSAPAWLREGVPHLKLDEHIAERMKN